MSAIPIYNGFLHGFNLIIPQGNTKLSKAMELIKTVLPLAALYPNTSRNRFIGEHDHGFAAGIMEWLPMTNIVHMTIVSVMERSLEGRKWVLARNISELACCVKSRSLALGIHTLCNIWEHKSSVPTTWQQTLTMEGVGHSLKMSGNLLYLGGLAYSRLGKNTTTLTSVLLVVQGLYQAFQLRSQGLKFLQQERGINYQTIQLGLDVGVKAIMTVVRFHQAYQVWNERRKPHCEKVV